MSAIKLVVNFVDDKNKKSSTKINIPTGFTISNYLEFADGAVQILANASRSRVTGAALCVKVDLSAASIRPVALAFSDVAEKAMIVLRSSVAGLFSRMKIPTLNESVLFPNSRVVDPANPDAAALITALEDGINVVGIGQIIQPVDLRGNDLAEVVSAEEMFRKS
ncbi:MAG: hypothetical protein WBC91_26505 [Phototrophicaceae bacterium]